MRCGYCGKIIADGSKFCAHCGQPVSGRPAEQQKSRDPGFVSGGFFESDDFNFDEDGMEPDRSAGRSSDMADRTMSLDDISKILRERSREYEQEYPGAAGSVSAAGSSAGRRPEAAAEDYGPDSDDFGLGSEYISIGGEEFGSRPVYQGQRPQEYQKPAQQQGSRVRGPVKEDSGRGFQAAGAAGMGSAVKGRPAEEGRAEQNRGRAGRSQNAGRAAAPNAAGRSGPHTGAGPGNAAQAETIRGTAGAGVESAGSGRGAGAKPVITAPGPDSGGSGAGSTGGHDRKNILQIIIILLVVLIVAMLGVILFIRLRNHGGAGTGEETVTQNTPDQEPEPGYAEDIAPDPEPDPEPDPGTVENSSDPEPDPEQVDSITETEDDQTGPGPDSDAGILDVFTYDGHTYALVRAGDVNVTDTNAMLEWCQAQGGYAATISSYSELVLLYNRMLDDGVYDASFGLTSDGGGWYWSGPEASDIVIWGKGAPGGNRINGCAHFDGKVQDGSWQAGTVSSDSRFLCEWEGVNGQYESAKVVPLISSTSFVYDDHNYAILDMSNYGIDEIDEENTNDDYLGYEALNRFCTVRGGHLAVIYDSQENDFLYGKVKELGAKSAFFGYSDYRSEGSWEWVTGNSSYTNWSSGQPNQTNAMEDYAQFYREATDGTWNDAPFGVNTTLFIIEWDYSR